MKKYPKQILTIPQQIQSYIDAEMAITSVDEVKEALQTIGYYRLRGYSFHLYDNSTKKYLPGTNFHNIMKLYSFDQELSHLLSSMLSKIEVTLRVRLVDALLIYNDALILQDSSIFSNKQHYWKNLSTISSEIARSSDVFIKHNFDNHEGEIPIWAVVEIMSFGTLSKVIKNLKTGKNSAFSVLANNYQFRTTRGNLIKPSLKMLSSWIQATSTLRNMCAHNSRIYNRTISTAPEIIDMDKQSPSPPHNGLYQILLAMKYLRPNDGEWMTFIQSLKKLIHNYEAYISLTSMNFPADWESHLTV